MSSHWERAALLAVSGTIADAMKKLANFGLAQDATVPNSMVVVLHLKAVH